MTAVFNNWETIRKRRGDILKPAEYRSIVEMISGILREYDFSGFNDTYKSFLAHLINYNDPHKVSETDFSNEIISRTYAIYVKMTATPLSEADFRETIVPTLGFIELIRRIVLNRILYDKVKNPDGTVPASASVVLTFDWLHSPSPNSPITLTFGSGINNEDDFIRKGWNTNTTPIPAILNANNLDVVIKNKVFLFHTSSSATYLNASSTLSTYPINLQGSSNDLVTEIRIVGNPTVKTVILSYLNGTDTFTISMSPDRTIELKLNTTVIATNVPCTDGIFTVALTKTGSVTVSAINNSVLQVSSYTTSFSGVIPFSSGLLGIPVEDRFTSTFGIKELTIYKNAYTTYDPNRPTPIIFSTPPSGTNPVSGTTSTSGQSAVFIPAIDYQLYLTLSGTWVGSVILQRTVDNGANWNSVTTNGGDDTGTFTSNCDEVVLTVTDPASRYRLLFNITSGSVGYRLGQ